MIPLVSSSSTASSTSSEGRLDGVNEEGRGVLDESVSARGPLLSEGVPTWASIGENCDPLASPVFSGGHSCGWHGLCQCLNMNKHLITDLLQECFDLFNTTL